MARTFPKAAAPLLALAILLLPRSALAYCRTTTCLDCPRDEKGCVAGGKPLSWSGRCVSFSVARAGSERLGVAHDAMLSVVSAAFERWGEVDCGGSAPSVHAAPTESPATCNRPDYDADSGNANVWMFHDGPWPYSDSALAVTVVTFDPDTGAILDADVELNATRELTLGDDSVDYDLASIVQHEAGHFLGLSHSEEKSATMWRRIVRGSTDKRTLESDDTAAICAAYPPERPADACDYAPKNGFSAECSPPDGCTTVARGRAVPSWLALIAVVFLVHGRRRWRTRRVL
jgi:hypothetical protein